MFPMPPIDLRVGKDIDEIVNRDILRFNGTCLGSGFNAGLFYVEEMQKQRQRDRIVEAVGLGALCGVFGFLVFLWLLVAGLP